MTYCIGVMLERGMIFASDSRTNAGLDNIAKFCKMTVFERRGDRVIVLLSSGNLAGTQAVIGVLNQRCVDGAAFPVHVPICCQFELNPVTLLTHMYTLCGPIYAGRNVTLMLTLRVVPEPIGMEDPLTSTRHCELLIVPLGSGVSHCVELSSIR